MPKSTTSKSTLNKATPQQAAQDRLAALERQVARVQRRMDALDELVNRLKSYQLMLFVGGVLGIILGLTLFRLLGVVLVLALIIAFVWLAGRVSKTNESYLKHKTLLELMETQVARCTLNWDALPPTPPRDVQANHPFDADLDITGERSLHQLINTAVSIGGTYRLRDWLLTRQPDPVAMQERQERVRELIPLTRFRNQLMVKSLFTTRLSSALIEGDQLVSWLEGQAQNETRQRVWTLWVAVGLAVLLYLSIALFIFAHTSALFCVAALLACLLWFTSTRKEQGNVTRDARYIHNVMGQLQPIFEYLERYPYAKHSKLEAFCEPFRRKGDRSPSFLLKKFERISRRVALGSDELTWLIVNTLVPLGAYSAYEMDRYRVLAAEYVPLWLETWYELEALNSLANFAYLNPDYVMPEVVPERAAGETALFQAVALGHPLIKRKRKVVNDFALNQLGEMVMVTGSNMSGKSTFLRTMGINLCLAYAGSVVNAASLRASLFEIYGCIRVTDSLADGYSYFYAEVRRLKGLLDALEQGTRYPVFFLIDEIFKGTNHYERLVGSEAYIRALIGKRCVGAVSTHDLELVRLSELFPNIRNIHFREDVQDGRMVFTYLLRPGPSPTRNALRIMQMEGLPVQWDGAPL